MTANQPNGKNTKIIIENWNRVIVATIETTATDIWDDPEANPKAQTAFQVYCRDNGLDFQRHAWQFEEIAF